MEICPFHWSRMLPAKGRQPGYPTHSHTVGASGASLVNEHQAPLHGLGMHGTCSSCRMFGMAGTPATRVCRYAHYAQFGRNTRQVESQSGSASSRFHRTYSAETRSLDSVK